MKILISGGEKSVNIVNGIRSKFAASGDEFIVIPYIEDIPAMYSKGDTFDKALITMESVTRDNSIQDESVIRQRINTFALDASKRIKKSLYVFLSPIEEMANIMQEETLAIEKYTAVILKAKPYSVQFFVDILVKDVAQIPADLIYKPSLIGVEQKFGDVDLDDIDTEPQVVVRDNAGFEDDFDFSDKDDNLDNFRDDFDDIDEDFGLDDGFGDNQFGDNQFGDNQFGDNQFDADGFSGNQFSDGQFSDDFGDAFGDDFGDEEFDANEPNIGQQFGTTEAQPFEDTVDPFAINSGFQDGEDVQLDDSILDSVEGNELVFGEDNFQNMQSNQFDEFDGNDEFSASTQDGFDTTGSTDFNSNIDDFGDDMAKVQDNPNNNESVDNFSDYNDLGSQADFGDEQDFDDFGDGAFDENEGESFTQNYSENELDRDHYSQHNNSEGSGVLGGLVAGATVATAVGAGVVIGKASNAVANTTGAAISKALSTIDKALDGGDANMRISGNNGVSNGEPINGQQYQQPYQQSINSDYIPGFDDEYEGDDIANSQGGQSMNPGYNQSSQYNKFDEYSQTTGYDDFSQDDFGQDAYEQAGAYQQSGINAGLTGEELRDFDEDAYNEQPQNPMDQMNQMNQMDQMSQTVEQKKGLFGGMFGRNKKNTNAMVGAAGAMAAANMASQANPNMGNGLGAGYNQPINNANAAQVQLSKGAPNQMVDGKGKPANVNKVRDKLKPFAARGAAIAVTGFGGSGTSTVAYGLANILCQLGYSVLLVDFDVKGRTQSYITRSCYDAVEPESANIMAAVNSTTGVDRQLSIVKEGFHLLTMGLGADIKPIEEMIKKEKLNRFFNTVKNKHQFVIYDMPFDCATGFCSEITYNCDNIVMVADSSNWGMCKMMLDICNIASEDMQDTIFTRGQVIINKHRNMKKLFGHGFRNAYDMLGILDRQVVELVGDVGLHFSNMRISGIIPDDPAVEDTYFTENNYSDTRKGQNIFLELVQNILLNK